MLGNSATFELSINDYEKCLDRILLLWGCYLFISVLVGVFFLTLQESVNISSSTKIAVSGGFSIVTLLFAFVLSQHYTKSNHIARKIVRFARRYYSGDKQTDQWLQSLKVVPPIIALAILFCCYCLVVSSIVMA